MIAILELITIGARIFSDERREHFANRSKKLLLAIQEVSDTDFYNKDMEKKGKAERALILDTEELRQEFVRESMK